MNVISLGLSSRLENIIFSEVEKNNIQYRYIIIYVMLSMSVGNIGIFRMMVVCRYLYISEKEIYIKRFARKNEFIKLSTR